MRTIAYLVTDLLFVSKIREVARQRGVETKSARTAEDLAAAAAGATLVILDLRLPQAFDALDRLRADPATAAIPTVGFIDHERTELMETARAKGCGKVLAKGAFSNDLPNLIPAA
jgi:CheY-like chemotaxis protein